LFLSTICTLALGQDNKIGTDVCICSPTTFTFTLNLNYTCPGTITENNGIAEIACFVLPVEGSTDLAAVEAESIQVLELDMNLRAINQRNYEGPFFDGESIIFSSVSTGQIDELTEVPGGLQLNSRLKNAAGELIIVTFSIDYTNDCNFTPILDIGARSGPIIFSDFTSARPEYCPAVPTEAPVTPAPVTPVPTAVQPVTPPPTTSNPTGAPTTQQPVTPATVAPSTQPSKTPTKAPTDKPSPPSTVKPTSLAPISLSPIDILYPTEFSFSYSYQPIPNNKKSKKKSNKKSKTSKKTSKDGGGSDDDDDDDDDTGLPSKKTKTSPKNEKEGGKKKTKKRKKVEDYERRRLWY